eukprot:SAG22_NODE_7_length_40155_cov_25.241356_37_plen_115_part_00
MLLRSYEYYKLLSDLVAAAAAKGIDVTVEKAKLKIPDKVFQSVHVGNCADSLYAINASADLGIYPRSILWSEDPIVQRTQRDAVAEAILSVKWKMMNADGPRAEAAATSSPVDV